MTELNASGAAEPMSEERLAEIRAEVERLADKAAKPNPWPADNEAHLMTDGWTRGTANALTRTTRPLLAEVERLRAELKVAFGPSLYFEIQKVLDGALGTEETDGTGAGIVADITLIAERMRSAEAERDRLAEQAQRVLHLMRPNDLNGGRTPAWVSVADLRAALDAEADR